MAVIPMDPGQPFENGDIITIDSGTRDANVDNEAAAAGRVFGIAKVKAVTANASIDRDAQPGIDVAGTASALNVMLALPGTVFQGNIIDTGINDHTGVYLNDIRLGLETLESTEGFACIEDAVAAVQVFTLAYVSPMWDTLATVPQWNHGREAGVGVENPRVQFIFVVDNTVFGAT